MKTKTSQLRNQTIVSSPTQPIILVGEIFEITKEGMPIVKFSGAPKEGILARVTAQSEEFGPSGQLINRSVVILLQDSDPEKPIIIGVIRDTIAEQIPDTNPATQELPFHSVSVNGKSLMLEGKEEIVLRCGAGSITMKANGQIIVKGTKLLSRATQSNKVRSSSVFIN